MRKIWNVLFWVLMVVSVCLTSPASSDAQDTGNLYNWAFAPAFGTGLYTVEGQETLVVTFRPKIDLRRQVDDKIGIKLTLPLSFGLQNVDVDNIFGEDLPDMFSTISFVPGVEFDIPIGKRWQVRPFGNFGWGTRFGGDESAWIYFAGAKSRYQFEWGKADLGFLSGLLWSGYSPTPGKENDYARYMLGIEADYPIGNVKFRKQQLLFRPHFLYYRYFNDLEFLAPVADEGVISLDQEVVLAVAVGTKEYQKFWLFRPDRIGIGLNLSKNLTGISIFMRSVFD